MNQTPSVIRSHVDEGNNFKFAFIIKKLNCRDVIGKASRGLQIPPVRKILQLSFSIMADKCVHFRAIAT